jgi:hypothetical protein
MIDEFNQADAYRQLAGASVGFIVKVAGGF